MFLAGEPGCQSNSLTSGCIPNASPNRTKATADNILGAWCILEHVVSDRGLKGCRRTGVISVPDGFSQRMFLTR